MPKTLKPCEECNRKRVLIDGVCAGCRTFSLPVPAKVPDAVWIAEMQSANFTFKAMGNSKADAIGWLRIGLLKHCESHGIKKFWDASDINVFKFQRGTCYRDYTIL